jgi:hypothetical protein
MKEGLSREIKKNCSLDICGGGGVVDYKYRPKWRHWNGPYEVEGMVFVVSEWDIMCPQERRKTNKRQGESQLTCDSAGCASQ